MPNVEMSHIILDEGRLRELPVRQRLDKCTAIIQNETDESLRWDAVWLAGEIAELNSNSPLYDEVVGLMSWVLEHETNGVVKHEACYQIAARDMRSLIQNLIQTALNDASIVAKHEAIESLGLMRAFDAKNLIAKSLDDPNPDVRETASFVMKRLERLQKLKEKYVPSKMSHIILDEGRLRELPVRQRLDKCTAIIQNETDESLRWDAVWLAGEIAELNSNSPLYDEVVGLMSWVLEHETNGVVKHEACYQIAARDMRSLIQNLIQTALNDASIVAKHEAIESLGLMRAFDAKNLIAKSLDDPNPDVRETASFVMKRLERLQKLKEKYVPSTIL